MNRDSITSQFRRGEIYCGSNGKCNLNCMGQLSCMNAKINADSSNDTNITLIANGENAFYSGDLIGSKGNSVIMIECNDNYACKQSLIRSDLSSKLTIIGNGTEILKSAKIYCPNNYHYKDITCHIIVSGMGVIDSIDIYVAESFHDLYLNIDTIQVFQDNDDPILHCMTDYDQQCVLKQITHNSWKCNDISSICQDYRYPTEAPTNMTTETPTIIPTAEPTILYTTQTPTTFPTLSPIHVANHTFGVRMNITFKYILNDKSISMDMVEFIINNITDSLLKKQLLTIDNDDCMEIIVYKISYQEDDDENIANINATIYVCKIVDQEELIQDVNRNLKNDLINFMNNDDRFKSMDKSDVMVEFEEIYLIDTTTTTTTRKIIMISTTDLINDNEENKRMVTRIIVILIIIFLIILSGILFICYYMKTLHDDDNNNNNNNTLFNNNNNNNNDTKRKKNKRQRAKLLLNPNTNLQSIQSQSGDMDSSMDGVMSNTPNGNDSKEKTEMTANDV